MEELEIVGQVVGGKTAELLIREKSGKKIELGDLLIAEEEGALLILQVYDLAYGSQVPQSTRELLAGLKLEGYGTELTFLEPELRNYVIAKAKAVARIEGKDVKVPKTLPRFFSYIRYITEKDLEFFTKPPNPVYVGKVRSGSKKLDVDVYLNGVDVFTHHVVIPATTGRGKSNLVKVMLWSILDQPNFGVLILDPHDEYYGRHGKGLKDSPYAKDSLIYYSSTPFPGTNTLIVNLRSILPSHFQGIVEFTDAQLDAIRSYYNRFEDEWIENIVRGTEVDGVAPRTLEVLQRKFYNVLGVYLDDDGNLQCRSKVFSDTAGQTTTKDIVNALEKGKKVIVDTSRLLDQAELLIGSIIVSEIFYRYQIYKSEGKLEDKPVVSIVIEEAPRVLGTDVLASLGENIYSTVAREGRKFKIGLIAITQLISLIPRQILANMNTKIILGNEMAVERKAIIDSAAQDLSEDDRTIASLDRGEAILSSSFTKFAVPVQIPLFEDYIKATIKAEKDKTIFVG
ncbi:MAG: ATP-binding protein [Nitrososphaeria archaeon]|nr:ATP-binding protein [Nitrososphaeria archaeon]